MYSIALFLSGVAAWGATGHHITGAIAERFLTLGARKTVERLLPHGVSLSKSCSWADEIKSDHSFDWAHDLHFISGQIGDDMKCSVDLQRDCASGVCVVNAITNYTTRITNSDYKTSQEALLFLVHFVGDIHQPLHNCGKLKGGNDYHVKFRNRTSTVGWNGHRFPLNLHTLWDDTMLVEHIHESFGSQDVFVTHLVNRIQTDWAQHKWLDCDGEEFTLVCPLKWSQFSGKLNCDTIWIGVNGTETDLGGEYYQRSIPVLEKQLAKAGVRMAGLLNALLDKPLFIQQH